MKRTSHSKCRELEMLLEQLESARTRSNEKEISKVAAEGALMGDGMGGAMFVNSRTA